MRLPSISGEAARVHLRRRAVPRLVALVLLATAAFAALPGAAAGQAPYDQPHPPPYYAIINANEKNVRTPVEFRKRLHLQSGNGKYGRVPVDP